jgi:hypothetical protein
MKEVRKEAKGRCFDLGRPPRGVRTLFFIVVTAPLANRHTAIFMPEVSMPESLINP